MRIVKRLKDAFHRFSCWLDLNLGPDRLTLQPRRVNDDFTVNKRLHDLRKMYRFCLKTNIAVTGGKAVGKKSFIKTFEEKRFFPIGKFLRVDICTFVEQCRDITSFRDFLDPFILKSIVTRAQQGELLGSTDDIVKGPMRIYRKPFVDIMIGVLMGVMLHTKDQWIDYVIYYLPAWEPQGINLFIIISGIIIILWRFNSLVKWIVAFWPLVRLNIKVALKRVPAEVSIIDGGVSRYKTRNSIIYVLKRMRWRIGHTVVFENLDTLGEEVFPRVISHLRALNKDTNSHVKAWKFWDIAPFRRPIRFIYIYRNDVIQLGVDTPLFDDSIEIPPAVTADNAFSELKRLFERETLYGASFPIDELYPVAPKYETHVSRYIADRRILNMIVKRFIYVYDDFVLRLEPEKPLASDIQRLFSLVLFSLFFQKEYAKIINRTSIVLTGGSGGENIDPKYRGLFKYLISNDCPISFRVNYLCMRYINPRPGSAEEDYAFYEDAYKNGDYPEALVFIERAICCNPDNMEFIKKREEILRIISSTH